MNPGAAHGGSFSSCTIVDLTTGEYLTPAECVGVSERDLRVMAWDSANSYLKTHNSIFDNADEAFKGSTRSEGVPDDKVTYYLAPIGVIAKFNEYAIDAFAAGTPCLLVCDLDGNAATTATYYQQPETEESGSMTVKAGAASTSGSSASSSTASSSSTSSSTASNSSTSGSNATNQEPVDQKNNTSNSNAHTQSSETTSASSSSSQSETQESSSTTANNNRNSNEVNFTLTEQVALDFATQYYTNIELPDENDDTDIENIDDWAELVADYFDPDSEAAEQFEDYLASTPIKGLGAACIVTDAEIVYSDDEEAIVDVTYVGTQNPSKGWSKGAGHIATFTCTVDEYGYITSYEIDN